VADPQILITTSWDDGHELDTKMAAFLADHGYSGTFYVSPLSREIPPRNRISDSSLRDLSARFEVGCHTLTHPHLTRISSTDAAHEISDGKRAVEDMIGQVVSSFCYPYGDYNLSHVEMVRAAGFCVGRTTRRFSVAMSPDPLQMSTTTHAARYKADGLRIPRRTASPIKVIRMWRNWDILARRVFEEAYEQGGVIHIWGHSREIEDNTDWRRLASLLDELAGHDNVKMLTNGELGERIRGMT
jgi:peptidoglycan/xylan/chitin deacetylase (PgdA/CDA1 family)